MSDETASRQFTREQLAYVEDLAATITASGVQRMPSRVYAAILVSEQGSMTAAELAAALQISPAAVSSAVRWLAQIGMISRRTVPGTRREQYVVDSDSLIRLLAQDTNSLHAWIVGFGRGLAVVEPGGEAARRLTDLQEFFAFLLEEMDGVMQRWYARRGQATPRPSADPSPIDPGPATPSRSARKR